MLHHELLLKLEQLLPNALHVLLCQFFCPGLHGCAAGEGREGGVLWAVVEGSKV
jgi:hypothetical protein